MAAAQLSPIFVAWSDIQDVIGVASAWPAAIRRFFWTRNLGHWDRTRVVAFVWINGLHMDLFLDWAHLIGMAEEGSAGYVHMRSLHAYIYSGVTYNLFAWNITRRRYEYLDGTPRYY